MNEIDQITVVFTVDENFVQHLGVTILSLLHNRKADAPTHIIVIGDGLSNRSKAALRQITEDNNASIALPEMKFKKFKELPGPGRATYGRFFCPDISKEDKLLYLDSDILVRDDISALWDIDISEYYAAAVFDMGSPHGHDHQTKLGMPSGAPYFNSGVLLLNNKKCRQDNVMENAFKFLLANQNKLVFRDQDGLNAVMYHNWLPLHPRWNVQTYMFNSLYKRKLRNSVTPEVIEAVKDPAIVHYTEANKPWHYVCEVPYVEEYYKYLAMTSWKDYQQKDWTFRGMIRKNRRMFKRRLKSAILGYRV